MSTASAPAEAAPLFEQGAPTEAAPDKEAAPAAKDDAKPDKEAAPKADEAPAPWWERVAKGKWKSEDEALKGYAESSKEARAKAKEAEEAAAKAAAFEERWNGVATLIGAPVDKEGKEAPYAFTLPEGASVMPEAMAAFEAHLRAKNLSQAYGQELLESVAIPYAAGLELGFREAEQAVVIEELGAGNKEVAAALAAEAWQWATAQVPKDHPERDKVINAIREASGTSSGVLALHYLRGVLAGVSPGQGGNSMGGGQIDEAAYKKIIGDSGWYNDKDKAAQVEEYLNRVSPGGGPKEDGNEQPR